MKKKIMLGMAISLVLSAGVAMASPTEIDTEKWNVSMGAILSPDVSEEASGEGFHYRLTPDGDTSFYGTVTYGISDRWGIGVDYSHYDSSYSSLYDVKLDATEYNLYYRLCPYMNVFAGYVYAGLRSDFYEGSVSYHVDGYQLGVSGWYPILDRVKVFGRFAAGEHSRVWEAGLSYTFAPRWDLDVAYRDSEYQDFAGLLDYSYDGMRVGISTTF